MIFYSEFDEQNEAAIADAMLRAWHITAHRYGKLDPIDWWLERDEKCVGWAEAKARTCDSSQYPTVFLSAKKWLALTLAQMTGGTSIFVVQFTNEIRWIKIGEVDPRKIVIAGRPQRLGSANDREPIIEVPIADMRPMFAAEVATCAPWES